MSKEKCKIKSKPIKSWSELKEGDKFVVVRGDTDYPKNVVLTMARNGKGDSDGDMKNFVKEHLDKSYLRWTNVERVLLTVDQFKSEVAELKAHVKDMEAKIKFCEETGCEEFDQNEFDIYQALDVLDGKGTRQEKAKALAELLKCK